MSASPQLAVTGDCRVAAPVDRMARVVSMSLPRPDSARTGEPWCDFPQTHSMIGAMDCTVRLSRSWEEEP